mmetsp:Transcript_50672/g.107495  ORF Transcript_50672/g.107495 Transcript_50672/m.107495 type:complete len:271 (+) Transcript_50672:216-1028(+)
MKATRTPQCQESTEESKSRTPKVAKTYARASSAARSSPTTLTVAAAGCRASPAPCHPRKPSRASGADLPTAPRMQQQQQQQFQTYHQPQWTPSPTRDRSWRPRRRHRQQKSSLFLQPRKGIRRRTSSQLFPTVLPWTPPILQQRVPLRAAPRGRSTTARPAATATFPSLSKSSSPRSWRSRASSLRTPAATKRRPRRTPTAASAVWSWMSRRARPTRPAPLGPQARRPPGCIAAPPRALRARSSTTSWRSRLIQALPPWRHKASSLALRP